MLIELFAGSHAVAGVYTSPYAVQSLCTSLTVTGRGGQHKAQAVYVVEVHTATLLSIIGCRHCL